MKRARSPAEKEEEETIHPSTMPCLISETESVSTDALSQIPLQAITVQDVHLLVMPPEIIVMILTLLQSDNPRALVLACAGNTVLRDLCVNTRINVRAYDGSMLRVSLIDYLTLIRKRRDTIKCLMWAWSSLLSLIGIANAGLYIDDYNVRAELRDSILDSEPGNIRFFDDIVPLNYDQIGRNDLLLWSTAPSYEALRRNSIWTLLVEHTRESKRPYFWRVLEEYSKSFFEPARRMQPFRRYVYSPSPDVSLQNLQ